VKDLFRIGHQGPQKSRFVGHNRHGGPRPPHRVGGHGGHHGSVFAHRPGGHPGPGLPPGGHHGPRFHGFF